MDRMHHIFMRSQRIDYFKTVGIESLSRKTSNVLLTAIFVCSLSAELPCRHKRLVIFKRLISLIAAKPKIILQVNSSSARRRALVEKGLW